ncbi:MAG: YcxB family protein [Lachnospiraceae bacterium]
MKYEIQVTMKPEYMRAFQFRHNYTKVSGILGVLISIVALVMCVLRWPTMTGQERALLLLIAALFLIVQPLMLLKNAGKQVRNNPIFRESIGYEISDEGITVKQGEEAVAVGYENIRKCVFMKKQLVVYTSAVHAFIMPYEDMGECKDSILNMIETGMKNGNKNQS